MSFESGTRLGPYEVTAAIGEGGMGQVFRARIYSEDFQAGRRFEGVEIVNPFR